MKFRGITLPSPRALAARAVVLSLPLLASGCFLFSSGPQVDSLSLKEATHITLLRTASEPPVYRLIDDAARLCRTADRPCWVTAIKSCSSEGSVAKHGLSRQLFVGMHGVQVGQFPPILNSAGEQLFPSAGRALLDDVQVEVVTLQKRSGDCITDLVSWRRASSEALSEDDRSDWLGLLAQLRLGTREDSA